MFLKNPISITKEKEYDCDDLLVEFANLTLNPMDVEQQGMKLDAFIISCICNNIDSKILLPFHF